MVRCMQRTNIYLTEDQTRGLDTRARMAGTTRSAVIRSMLDEGLAGGSPADDELRGAFGRVADHYDELVAGLFDDDPDLRVDA